MRPLLQVQNVVSVNERLGKGQAVQKMGRQVDRLLGPLQERKIDELQTRLACLQAQVLHPRGRNLHRVSYHTHLAYAVPLLECTSMWVQQRDSLVFELRLQWLDDVALSA